MSPGKQELPSFNTQMISPPDYSRSPGKQELPTFKTQMTSEWTIPVLMMGFMLLICLVFSVMPFCWSSFCVSCQMLPMSMDNPLLIAPSDLSCVYLYLKTKNMHRLYWFDFNRDGPLANGKKFLFHLTPIVLFTVKSGKSVVRGRGINISLKRKTIYYHLINWYFVTVNQFVMTTVEFWTHGTRN
jgi:hypothetical protein